MRKSNFKTVELVDFNTNPDVIYLLYIITISLFKTNMMIIMYQNNIVTS